MKIGGNKHPNLVGKPEIIAGQLMALDLNLGNRGRLNDDCKVIESVVCSIQLLMQLLT